MKKGIFYFKEILPYFKGMSLNLVKFFLVGVFGVALSLVSPLLLKLFFDVVLPSRELGLLNWLIFGMLALLLIEGAVKVFSEYLGAYIGEGVIFNLRNKLFWHIERQRINQPRRTGDLLNRMQRDAHAILTYVNLLFENFFLNIIRVAFILGAIFFLDFKVALTALVVIPFYVFVQKKYAKKLRSFYTQVREKGAEMYNFLEERFSKLFLIKIYAKEKKELNRFKNIEQEMIRKDLDFVFENSLVNVLIGTISFGALILVLWAGGYRVIMNGLSVGSLIAIYTYFAKLFAPLGELININLNLQSVYVSIERILSVIRTKEEKGGNKTLKNINKIEIKNLSYALDKKRRVLDKFNAVFEKGKVYGITGKSGEGKSTLIMLMYNFISPDKGKILVDGRNIEEYSLTSLRNRISYVDQEPLLFDQSIYYNLRYGAEDVSKEDIRKACEDAGILDFIESLPRGFDTVVGKDAIHFSVGQKQRLGIARALLKKAEVFVFDEPSSSLDVYAEEKVIDTVMGIKNKIVIIISHRLNTLKRCDKIILLEKGKAVERGSFNLLMKKKGKFYSMYRRQAGKQ